MKSLPARILEDCRYFVMQYSVAYVSQIYAGSEINFFRQAPSGDGIFFFSRHMEKYGRQKAEKKVSIKFFLRSETQTKMFGCQMENSGRQFFF